MSAPAIVVDNIGLNYPVYTIKSQSIRRTALQVVGGRLFRTKNNSVVVRALEDVSFTIYNGERVALFGHNGSGKTTLLRVISEIYTPTSGRIETHGKISAILDVGFGMSIEATGRENMYLLGLNRGIPRKVITALIPEIEDFAELGGFFDMPVRTYSAGMVTRLAFSFATAISPDILVLDEWLAPGDAEFIQRAMDRMQNFAAQARVLVVASHNKELIKSLCSRVIVLEKGQVIFDGDPLIYFDH
jgi:ABC-type polysaccharide/polyol phosphate transport system ATPase subunit